MSIVIDASLTLTWYFEDEATPATDAILDRVSDAGAVYLSYGDLKSPMPFSPRSGASASRRIIATTL